jgi:hypothetical protein
MIKYKIIESSNKLNEGDLSEVETLLNKKFPKELRNFYLNNNGGEIEGDRFIYNVDKDDNEYAIQTFFPIKYKRTKGDSLLEKWTLMYCNEKRIPENYIVFGCDWGGAPYCCEIETGHIYFADPDNDDDNLENRMEFICTSLEEFINNMKTEDEFENLN